MKRLLGFLITVLLLAPCAVQAADHDAQEVVMRGWAEYVAAQRQWHQTVNAFVVARRPDLKAVSEVSRELQIAYLDVQASRFVYLLEHHPERIALNRGADVFSSFTWGREDEAALRAGSSEYLALVKEVRRLREIYKYQKGMPAYRQYLRDVTESNEYRQALAKLAAQREAITLSLRQFLSDRMFAGSGTAGVN